MKIKIGRIEYINVDPVYYGFDTDSSLRDGLEIISRPPAILNKLMTDGELDISSVSSSAFARNSDRWLMLPDFSISCYGRVMSVLLVSRYQFEELDGKLVLLTDESATAVDLLKLLFSEKGIHPVFQTGKVKSPSDLPVSAGAGLVIGDAALKHEWHRHFPQVQDLCEMWNHQTGLPFVFGVWAVRKAVVRNYPEIISFVVELLQKSRNEGLKNISRITDVSAKKLGIDPEMCKTYYNSMNYSLSDPEFQSLNVFFNGLYSKTIIHQKPEISFFSNMSGRAAEGRS